MTADNALVPIKRIWIVRFWQSLTRAHPSIQEKGEIRRAQLLSGITLVFAIATGLGTVASIPFMVHTPKSLAQADFLELAALSLVFFCAYGFSRTRYITFGSILISAALIVSAVLFGMDTQFELGSALFITIPLIFILGIGLFSQRGMIGLFFMVMAGTISIWFLRPNIEISTYITTTGITLTMGFLSLVVVAYKDGVERERVDELIKANRDLDTSRQNLEQRVAERTTELQTAKEQTES